MGDHIAAPQDVAQTVDGACQRRRQKR